MYVKDGQGSVTYNNKTYSIKKDDVVLLNCHRPHSYNAKNSGLDIYWIHFDGNSSNEYFQYIYNNFGIVNTLKNPSIIPELFEKILNSFNSNNLIIEPLVSCYIQRMLTDIIINSNITRNNDYSNSPIFTAINYIQNNYKDKITLDSLASNSCLSPYYFSRLFKKETGYTPYQYITNIRINRAKTLLINSTFTIKEICFQCGFNSESNFVTSFKEHTGTTPSDFRNLYK